MAVASKSAVSTHRRPIPSKTRGVIPLPLKTMGKPSRDRTSGQTVPILPSSQSAPSWLLRLCAIQRRSSVVMFVLVVAMAAVYGWTVYSQRMWSQAYRKLEILQRHERQLTATNEVLKNQMALQAEKPAMGLVPPNPASLLFLQPAPQRPAPAASPATPVTKPTAQTKQPTPIPLGY